VFEEPPAPAALAEDGRGACGARRLEISLCVGCKRKFTNRTALAPCGRETAKALEDPEPGVGVPGEAGLLMSDCKRVSVGAWTWRARQTDHGGLNRGVKTSYSRCGDCGEQERTRRTRRGRNGGSLGEDGESR
jgi:hypothetical protein